MPMAEYVPTDVVGPYIQAAPMQEEVFGVGMPVIEVIGLTTDRAIADFIDLDSRHSTTGQATVIIATDTGIDTLALFQRR